MFEVTNSAGSVRCVTSTTDIDTDILFSIATGIAAMGHLEQLSSLINLSKDCSARAASPPDFLTPVAVLTATSTTHLASLPPAPPAPASPPTMSVPTVTSNPQSSTPEYNVGGSNNIGGSDNVGGSNNVGGSSALVAGGQAVTVAGTPYPLAPGETALIVAGSSTQILSPAPLVASPTAKLFTFAGSTYTPNFASQYIISGQTLEPGSAITISGTPIALAIGATQIVVGSSTEALTRSSDPLASVIIAGFGSQASMKNVSGSGNSSVFGFTGVGSDKSVAQGLAVCIVGMVVAVVVL